MFLIFPKIQRRHQNTRMKIAHAPAQHLKVYRIGKKSGLNLHLQKQSNENEKITMDDNNLRNSKNA